MDWRPLESRNTWLEKLGERNRDRIDIDIDI